MGEWELLHLDTAVPTSWKWDGTESIQFVIPDIVAGRQYKIDLAFENPFAFPIEIESIKAECGCTSVFAPQGKYQSDEPVPLKVVYSAAKEAGRFAKSIAVKLKNGKTFYLVLVGQSLPAVEFVPASLEAELLMIGQTLVFEYQSNVGTVTNAKVRSDFVQETVKFDNEAKSFSCTLEKLPSTDSYLFFDVVTDEGGNLEAEIKLIRPSSIDVLPKSVSSGATKFLFVVVGELSPASSNPPKWRLVDPGGTIMSRLVEDKSAEKFRRLIGTVEKAIPAGIDTLFLCREGSQELKIEIRVYQEGEFK